MNNLLNGVLVYAWFTFLVKYFGLVGLQFWNKNT